jgi:hypothetical protein
MKILLLAFILFFNFSYAQNNGNDSLLCDIKKTKTDRLLLYDKDCFIWIRQEVFFKEKMTEVSFGQFKTISDTIYFEFPDSTRHTNKYYCYCKYEGHEFKGFQLYNIPETWPPGSLDRVYKDMYNSKTPNFSQFSTLVSFKAVKQKDKIIFTDYVNGKYIKREYIVIPEIIPIKNPVTH